MLLNSGTLLLVYTLTVMGVNMLRIAMKPNSDHVANLLPILLYWSSPKVSLFMVLLQAAVCSVIRGAIVPVEQQLVFKEFAWTARFIVILSTTLRLAPGLLLFIVRMTRVWNWFLNAMRFTCSNLWLLCLSFGPLLFCIVPPSICCSSLLWCYHQVEGGFDVSFYARCWDGLVLLVLCFWFTNLAKLIWDYTP